MSAEGVSWCASSAIRGEGVLPSSHFEVTETASTAHWICMVHLQQAQGLWKAMRNNRVPGGGWMNRSWPHLETPCPGCFCPVSDSGDVSLNTDLLWTGLSEQRNSFWDVSATQLLGGHLCFSPKKQHHYPPIHHYDIHPSLKTCNQQIPASFVQSTSSVRLLILRVVSLHSSFLKYKIKWVALPSQAAANLQFCFKDALSPLD